MSHRVATIARYTVLEALRTRLPLLMAVVIGTLLAASFFVREIAITEAARVQTGFYAAGVRFATVFIAALHVISSVTRDLQDKGLEVVLALDVPRGHYVVGKLAGFVATAAAIAVLAGAPLVPLAGAAAASQWIASLALELSIVAALALFGVITFGSLMPAASFVVAFYLLARSLTAVRLISANPISDAQAPSHQVMGRVVEALAYVVPPLDEWTRTEWLVDGAAAWSGVGALAAHSALFVVILTAAAVFDMHRRNF